MTQRVIRESLTKSLVDSLIQGLRAGEIVPCLGPGALWDVYDQKNNDSIPVWSDELILALNQGRPMTPRLMYEFPRAAMHVELKRGRSAVVRFLNELYGNRPWSRSVLHQWLSDQRVPYIIDFNRDTQLQDLYNNRPHTLILGVARISGTDYRYKIYQYDGRDYQTISQDAVNRTLPVLFKPVGSPIPEPAYLASDADFVDYLTELMGGFAIPTFLKEYRKRKRYLFLGLRLTRDTERIMVSELIFNHRDDPAAWALIASPSAKERRFCDRHGIKIVDADLEDFLQLTTRDAGGSLPVNSDAF